MGLKAEQTKSKLVASARRIIARDGLENLTYQTVADESKVSQPLVVHYFKKSENIFLAVVEDLLAYTLVDTKSALGQQESARGKLTEYIKVSFGFFRSTPETYKIYLTFYYLSGFQKTYRQLNNQLKLEATQRIMVILAQGIQSREFSVADTQFTAKMIHMYLTGTLLNLATEQAAFSDDVIISEMQKHVLMMVEAA